MHVISGGVSEPDPQFETMCDHGDLSNVEMVMDLPLTCGTQCLWLLIIYTKLKKNVFCTWPN